MSSASPLQSESPADAGQWLPARGLENALRSPVQFVGFWAGVVLPFVLLALVATGYATQQPAFAGGLVAGSFTGLLLGRGYNR